MQHVSAPAGLGPSAQDRAVKRERVLRLLEKRGIESVLLTSAPAINWYLDGARTHVSIAAPPILGVEVAVAGDRIHVTSNEVARVVDEELPHGESLYVRDWWCPLESGAVAEADLSVELRAVRSNLLPTERRRFAVLGSEAARAVTDAVAGAVPSLSERELAARVHAEVVRRGAEPLVVLVGGASRSQYRHPLPTDAPIGRRAMVVVCARRWGLIANLTRWVCFGPAGSRESDAEARIFEVEAEAFSATVAGARLDSVLDRIARAYERHGFGAHEWKRHHQGGLVGYDGRDPRATPGVPDVIPADAHVGWNPSAAGAKVEDTVVVGGGTVLPLTVDPRWPVTDVNGVLRPLTLEL